MESISPMASGGHEWNNSVAKNRVDELVKEQGRDINSLSFSELRHVAKDAIGGDMRSWVQERHRVSEFVVQYRVTDEGLAIVGGIDDGKLFKHVFIDRVRELGPQLGYTPDEAELTRLEEIEQSFLTGSDTIYSAAGERGAYRYLQTWKKRDGMVVMNSFDIAAQAGRDLTKQEVSRVIKQTLQMPQKEVTGTDKLVFTRKADAKQNFFQEATQVVKDLSFGITKPTQKTTYDKPVSVKSERLVAQLSPRVAALPRLPAEPQSLPTSNARSAGHEVVQTLGAISKKTAIDVQQTLIATGSFLFERARRKKQREKSIVQAQTALKAEARPSIIERIRNIWRQPEKHAGNKPIVVEKVKPLSLTEKVVHKMKQVIEKPQKAIVYIHKRVREGILRSKNSVREKKQRLVQFFKTKTQEYVRPIPEKIVRTAHFVKEAVQKTATKTYETVQRAVFVPQKLVRRLYRRMHSLLFPKRKETVAQPTKRKEIKSTRLVILEKIRRSQPIVALEKAVVRIASISRHITRRIKQARAFRPIEKIRKIALIPVRQRIEKIVPKTFFRKLWFRFVFLFQPRPLPPVEIEQQPEKPIKEVKVAVSQRSWFWWLWQMWLRSESELQFERPQGVAFGQTTTPLQKKHHTKRRGIIYAFSSQTKGSVIVG